jgi:hypothetical protein
VSTTVITQNGTDAYDGTPIGLFETVTPADFLKVVKRHNNVVHTLEVIVANLASRCYACGHSMEQTNLRSMYGYLVLHLDGTDGHFSLTGHDPDNGLQVGRIPRFKIMGTRFTREFCDVEVVR